MAEGGGVFDRVEMPGRLPLVWWQTAVCVSPLCPNQGQRWRIMAQEIQPGLLSLPQVLCSGCHSEPMISERREPDRVKASRSV